MEPTTTTPNPDPVAAAAPAGAAAPTAVAPAPGVVPAAAAPATTPTLAQRYTYAQLDAPHKAIADQLTVLILAYPDILRLKDPAAQRKFLEDFKNSGAGEALRNGGGAFADAMRLVEQVPGLGDAIRAGNTAGNIADTAADGVNAVAAGVGLGLSIPTSVVAGTAEFMNQIKVLGNDMTPEKARQLATAYASTLQARQVDRAGVEWWRAPFTGFTGENKIGNGFGTIFAYIGAIIATAVDWVRGTVFGRTDVRSFDEHLTRAFHKSDMDAVRTEMGRTPDLPNGEAWGHALTEGSVNQNLAGTDQAIAAPTVDNPVPTAPGAPVDNTGAPIIVPKDDAAVTADAFHQAVQTGGQVWVNAAKAVGTNPFAWALAGLTGVGVTMGAIEGPARGSLKQKDARAKSSERRYERAKVRVESLQNRLNLVENPEENNKRLFREKESPETLREQLEAARAEERRLEIESKSLRRAHNYAGLSMPLEADKSLNLDADGKFRVWRAVVNVPRHMARAATGWIGRIADATVHNGREFLRDIPERIEAGRNAAVSDMNVEAAQKEENKAKKAARKGFDGPDAERLETEYKEAQQRTAKLRAEALEARGSARGIRSGISGLFTRVKNMFGGKAETSAPEPVRAASAPDAPDAPDARSPAPEPKGPGPRPAGPGVAPGPSLTEVDAPRVETVAAKPKTGPMDWARGLWENVKGRGRVMGEVFTRFHEGGGVRGGVRTEGEGAATKGLGLAVVALALTSGAANAAPARPTPRPGSQPLSNDEMLAMQAAARVSPRVRSSVVGGTVLLNENGFPISGVPSSQQIRANLL